MSKKLTQEEFLERVKKVHCDTYRYDKTVVNGSKIPVIITCPIHGDFEQRPGDHLRGCGCPLCGIEKSRKAKKNTTEGFIEKAKKVHGNKYDYSKVEYIDKLTPVIINCPIHGEFTQTPDTHLNGSGCQKCGVEKSKQTAASQKLTTEKFIDRARKIHGDKYDYSKADVANKDNNGRVCIICHEQDEDGNEHGEFWVTPYNHMNGVRCKKCANKALSKERLSNTEDFIKKAKKIHGDKYDYSKVEYVDSRTKVSLICPIHGEFKITPNNHLCGSGCPICSGKNNTNEQMIEKFRKVHGDKYDYSKVDIKHKDEKGRICIICREHGEFWMTPSNHLKGKGCKKCKFIKLRNIFAMTQDDFIKKANEIHNNYYDYSLVKYVNGNVNVDIICPKHGKFSQRPADHLRGTNCPICACGNTSQSEKDIVDYIKTLLKKEEIFVKDKTIIKPMEIDILIPEFRLGIEYDGLYWHSEERGKNKHYHLEKTILAKENGIKLIHIFEDEWLEHRGLVEDKICHMLHKDTDKIKVGARKCDVKQISMMLAKPFFETFHIQGWAASTVYYGAFYNGKLIGVMSFLKESDFKWNLNRLAIDVNYAVPGLPNKLFKHFINEHNDEVNEVKTFLDRRWAYADVNVYDRMGFEMVKEIEPSYYYIKGQKRYHKFNFRKNILNKRYNLPLTMTETEMTKKLGYEKIWDCGLFKYVWRNSQQN